MLQPPVPVLFSFLSPRELDSWLPAFDRTRIYHLYCFCFFFSFSPPFPPAPFALSNTAIHLQITRRRPQPKQSVSVVFATSRRAAAPTTPASIGSPIHASKPTTSSNDCPSSCVSWLLLHTVNIPLLSSIANPIYHLLFPGASSPFPYSIASSAVLPWFNTFSSTLNSSLTN
ncbi:hypothetical protein BJX65DRAFT_239966 [Aspergillus insuetus]